MGIKGVYMGKGGFMWCDIVEMFRKIYPLIQNQDKTIERQREIRERRGRVEDYVWLLDEAMGDHEKELECLDGMEEALDGAEEEVVIKNLRHGGRVGI